LARSAGYAAVFEFDELEDFDNEAEEVLKQPGPVMVCVKTVPDIRGPRQPSGPVNTEVVQGRPQAIDNLLREFGRS
jgi:thiamine pyrophosphate-dependent acetolactate synthase large subunit-like protein